MFGGRQKKSWNLLALGKKNSFLVEDAVPDCVHADKARSYAARSTFPAMPWKGIQSEPIATGGVCKIGIIAGSGSLPAALADECLKAGHPFFVVALKGHADLKTFAQGIPLQEIRLGAIGKTFSLLKEQGVTDLVLVGGVRRPSVAELCPDWRGWSFYARLGVKALGDDGLLRAVIQETESEGFTVRGIHELMPQLLAPVGVLGAVEPNDMDEADIQRGIQVAKLLGEADVGQSVIVQQGLVLAVEGVEGTAALINRSKELKRKGDGGVLVKMVKPNQERRVDLPTIGVETVKAVYAAGLKGIAVEAQGVLIADVAQTVQEADTLGVFIKGVVHG